MKLIKKDWFFRERTVEFEMEEARAILNDVRLFVIKDWLYKFLGYKLKRPEPRPQENETYAKPAQPMHPMEPQQFTRPSVDPKFRV
jgi:hypothetical protein